MQFEDSSAIQSFLDKHLLTNDYIKWAKPIAEKVLSLYRSKNLSPMLLGINGAQGSGKSTFSAYLPLYLKSQNIRCAVLSLDDFYFSKQKRLTLAQNIQPLLATRGVPGTHDTARLLNAIEQLKAGSEVIFPKFNKQKDDLEPKDNWTVLTPPFDIIVLEGWCVGALPQSDEALIPPVNELERTQDKDGTWRKYVNDKLANEYADIFTQLNALLMFKAPSFDCIAKWRTEQEMKAQPNGDKTIIEQDIKNFVQYFERITKYSLLTLPPKTDVLVKLKADRTTNK